MPKNLPLNLSKSSLSKPQISAHAQNFSTSMLGQKRDILGAKTSVEKTIKGDGDFGPASSIFRLGKKSNSASTSVDRQDVNTFLEDDEKTRDEIRDRLRYKHIRQMIKNKKNDKK